MSAQTTVSIRAGVVRSFIVQRAMEMSDQELQEEINRIAQHSLYNFIVTEEATRENNYVLEYIR